MWLCIVLSLVGSTHYYSVTNEGEYKECITNSNQVTMKIMANIPPPPQNHLLNHLLAIPLQFK